MKCKACEDTNSVKGTKREAKEILLRELNANRC